MEVEDGRDVVCMQCEKQTSTQDTGLYSTEPDSWSIWSSILDTGWQQLFKFQELISPDLQDFFQRQERKLSSG